jgi:hypothetical protein
MFTREEASLLRKEFWTTFGKYMRPVPSAEGLKVNWINYHTRVKDVYFRMEADNDSAVISISLEHNDAGIRELYFEQFLEFKTMLHTSLGEEWYWVRKTIVDGRDVSRIYIQLPRVSVFNRNHWPDLISFFKPRIIALDAFWENARYTFESLA